jgi:hypothetical protein
MLTKSLVAIAAASLFASATPVDGQSLAARISAARSDAVTFHFASRVGLCGDGESFIRIGRSYHGSFTVGRPMEPCIPGPVQVRLALRDGGVYELRAYVGPLRARNARDLGAVPAAEAASYLMGIATRGRADASIMAIFPAVLADSATVWPALLAIAKDTETRSGATRREALLWLSRYASAAISGRPNDPFMEMEADHGDEDDLKKQAVFVMSQLPRSEAVPALLDVARTNRDPSVRSNAMFWLGQTGDPRAIALFEAVLRRD